MLLVKDLHAFYGRAHILHGLSLDAHAGEVPSAMRPPPGCRFHTRCPRVMEVCRSVDPPRRDMGDGRAVACHLYD